MAQYPIPQFIESEGKIISFLTFRQFFILVGGGAICLAFYYILPFTFFVILSVLVGLITAAVAFVKIDNESIPVIVLNFFKFTAQSKDYAWKKKESAYPFRVKKNPIHNVKELGTPPNESGGLKNAKNIVELRKKV